LGGVFGGSLEKDRGIKGRFHSFELLYLYLDLVPVCVDLAVDLNDIALLEKDGYPLHIIPHPCLNLPRLIGKGEGKKSLSLFCLAGCLAFDQVGPFKEVTLLDILDPDVVSFVCFHFNYEISHADSSPQ